MADDTKMLIALLLAHGALAIDDYDLIEAGRWRLLVSRHPDGKIVLNVAPQENTND